MKCPKCQVVNVDGKKFCQHCGQPLQIESRSSRFTYAGNVLVILYYNFQQISGIPQTPIDPSTNYFPISRSYLLSTVDKVSSLEI